MQAEAWESTLRARLAATWQSAWDENPLPEGRKFSELEPLMRLHILYQLCEWRADECPYVRGAIDRTVKSAGYGGDSLREVPLVVDSHGHRYYYFTQDHNSAVVYREVPPEIPQTNRNWRPQNDAEFWMESATLQELEAFAEHWKKRKHEGEKYLWEHFGEEVCPKLTETAAARERALERQRMFDEAPKKRSSRIATISVVKEQEEKLRAERAAELKIVRAEERARRQLRDAERRRLNLEIAATRAREDAETKRRQKLAEREKRYLKREKVMLKLQKKQQARAAGARLDWSTWEDGIEDGSIFWRVKGPRKPRGPKGITTGYFLVARGQRSCENGKPLRVRKPLTDMQILGHCAKIVEKMVVNVARDMGEDVSYQHPQVAAGLGAPQPPILPPKSHKKKSHKKKVHDPLKALAVAAFSPPKKSHKKKSHKKKPPPPDAAQPGMAQGPAVPPAGAAPGLAPPAQQTLPPNQASLHAAAQAAALAIPSSLGQAVLPNGLGLQFGVPSMPMQMQGSLHQFADLMAVSGAAGAGGVQQAQMMAMMQQALQQQQAFQQQQALQQQQQASVALQHALGMAPQHGLPVPVAGAAAAAAPPTAVAAPMPNPVAAKAEPQPAVPPKANATGGS